MIQDEGIGRKEAFGYALERLDFNIKEAGLVECVYSEIRRSFPAGGARITDSVPSSA